MISIFQRNLPFLLTLFVACLPLSCSSLPSVQRQHYAQLNNAKVFEYEFPVVWKAIEEVFRKNKIISRDPENATPLEMKKLSRRSLETDWVYGQSRDKYIEYSVNGFPRKIYLQTRFKYLVKATQVIGGVSVQVETEEEIERLDKTGKPAGYTSAQDVDTSRAHEILDRIGHTILSSAP